MSSEFTTERGDEHTHLIVLSDGSDFAWRAVDLAAELASADGLDLEVLEVVLLPGDVEATKDAIRRRFAQHTALRERVDARIGENLRVTALVQNGRIDETIAAEIDGRDDGSLIVMSSVGRGRSAALIGSVAEDLLRALHGPILLVGPQVDIESFDPSGRVLIAVDGSPLSEQAIGVGLAWAIEHGSTPWLVQSLNREFADADRGESAYLARIADDIYRRTELVPQMDQTGVMTSDGFGSAHTSGCHFAFCDGRVKKIRFGIDAEAYRQLGNRSGRVAVDMKHF